jgi:predicted nucleotidyltransferase
MDAQRFPPPHYQAVIDRFVAACRADERVAAAFLVGSYATGAADDHSDLDLFVVTVEGTFDDFAAGRQAFARQLGEPLFQEDFDLPATLFLIFPDGAEVELNVLPESRVGQLLDRPHWSLLDKKGLLTGAPPAYEADATGEAAETLRRQIAWFWHDLSHFVTALSRGRLWWASGQLEALRYCCLNLARLRHNLLDPDVGAESYFKIEDAVPAEELAALRATFGPLEPEAMWQAAHTLVAFYQALAQPLAEANGIPYPAELDRLMTARLASLDEKRPG